MMTENTFKLLNLIGSWLASVGTLAAVITSLWLARRQGQVRLTVTAKHVQLLTPGIQARPDYVNIKVVNVGIRPARVTSVGWQSGRFKGKKHIVQMFGDPNSDQIPKLLEEGEEVNLMIPFNATNDEKDWIKRFPKMALLANPHNKVSTLRLIVYTSVGQNFKVKVDKKLRDTLVKAVVANNGVAPDAAN